MYIFFNKIHVYFNKTNCVSTNLIEFQQILLDYMISTIGDYNLMFAGTPPAGQ